MNFNVKIKCGLLLFICWSLSGIAQDKHAATITAEAQDSSVTGNENAIYTPVYQLRRVSSSLAKKLKEDKRLQYVDTKKPRQQINWVENFLLVMFRYISIIRIIILILLLAGLGFLLFVFMKSNGMRIFRKPKQSYGLKAMQGEQLQSISGFEEKISAAIAAGDIRQTIRWWYLYTLFHLSNRQLITTSKEKTDDDYLQNMRNSPLYRNFAALTLNYEYIWYGGFEVSEESFKNIMQQFVDFNNALEKFCEK